MKKISLILLALSLSIISCEKSSNNDLPASNDLKKIITLMVSNGSYFINNSDKYPGTFYTTGISNSSKIDSSNKDELLYLLNKNNISKIYFYSEDEIWLVFQQQETFLKNKERLVGFTNEEIESAKIYSYKPYEIKSLSNKWYTLSIKHSIVD